MQPQTKKTIITILITLAIVGLVFFANKKVEEMKLQYYNRGATAVRNAIYSEILRRGEVDIAVMVVEQEGDEPRQEIMTLTSKLFQE